MSWNRPSRHDEPWWWPLDTGPSVPQPAGPATISSSDGHGVLPFGHRSSSRRTAADFQGGGVAASLSTPGLGGRNWDRTVLRFGRALLRSSRRPQSIIPPSLGIFTRSDGPGRADRNPIRCSEGPSDRKVVGPSDGCPAVPGPTRSTKERLVCSRSPPAEAAHPGMCFYRPHPGAEKHGWLNTACRCNSRSSPRWPWCFEPPPRRPARRRTDPRARRVGRGR